jgi:alpha-glucosidase
MDQANGVYSIRIAGKRAKGPRNPLRSTIAAETARVGQVFSGLVVLPDTPEAYRAHMDAFRVLVGIPATWDESLYLDGRFGEYAIIARRTGCTWYVFATTNNDSRSVNVPLCFLGEGGYNLYLVQDAPNADAVENPEAYEVSTGRVCADESLSVDMAPGGGFCAKMTCGYREQSSDE